MTKYPTKRFIYTSLVHYAFLKTNRLDSFTIKLTSRIVDKRNFVQRTRNETSNSRVHQCNIAIKVQVKMSNKVNELAATFSVTVRQQQKLLSDKRSSSSQRSLSRKFWARHVLYQTLLLCHSLFEGLTVVQHTASY